MERLPSDRVVTDARQISLHEGLNSNHSETVMEFGTFFNQSINQYYSAICYAERGIVRANCPPVCLRLSVTLRYCDHIGWNILDLSMIYV